MSHQGILARIEEFNKMGQKAREILIKELALRCRYNLPMTDFAYMNSNVQGYITHYRDNNGHNVLVSVAFAYENEHYGEDDSRVVWDETKPIITVS